MATTCHLPPAGDHRHPAVGDGQPGLHVVVTTGNRCTMHLVAVNRSTALLLLHLLLLLLLPLAARPEHVHAHLKQLLGEVLLLDIVQHLRAAGATSGHQHHHMTASDSSAARHHHSCCPLLLPGLDQLQRMLALSSKTVAAVQGSQGCCSITASVRHCCAVQLQCSCSCSPSSSSNSLPPAHLHVRLLKQVQHVGVAARQAAVLVIHHKALQGGTRQGRGQASQVIYLHLGLVLLASTWRASVAHATGYKQAQQMLALSMQAVAHQSCV